MKCPHCHSDNVKKDGHQNGKQGFECKECGRIFRYSYESKGYHPKVKRGCFLMYLNAMGFRAIERFTGIHHTTIMNWVKESAEELPEDEADAPIIAHDLEGYSLKKVVLQK